jgi:diguanylate cyclase (GGDEF)-like protein
VRKRLAIVGHSEEGVALIPLLEANPEIEISAIVTTDRNAALEVLRRVDPRLASRFSDQITADLEPLLRATGLVALVDADAPEALRERFNIALERGIQVTTPLIAKLLFAFGPVDATRKPDLLQTLSEILESYNLTIDRRGILNRILQIAIGATGADRGSLMLYNEEENRLVVEVAIGIEKELIPKIRLEPGEGIAGLAFQEQRAILLSGKADRKTYRIARERDDVESAISAPLVHNGRILGVLNLSHGLQRGAFTEEDLSFVEQLARLDAKIIARAEEYHGLLCETARLRAEAEVRRVLAGSEPLPERLSGICHLVAEELNDGICHLYLRDPDLDELILQASSTWLDPLASRTRVRPNVGILGWVAAHREPAVLASRLRGSHVCFAVLPLIGRDTLLGVFSFEGTHEGSWPELLKDKLEAVSDALATGLDDALRELRAEREATKMAAITELAARMGAAGDSAELYRSITSSAAMVLEAEHAVLRVQDETSGRYQIRSYFGSAETDAQGPLFECEKELAVQAIKQRAPICVADLDAQPELAKYHTGVTCALVQPLMRGGRTFGTLSVLGKVAREALSGESFGDEDQKILARFCEYAQRALDYVLERERSRHRQRFDDLTGLPNALHLRERLEEEIARSAGRGHPFALVRLRLTGLAELIEEQAGSEADRLVLSLVQELRGGLREYDVMARTGAEEFQMILPEPEADLAALLGPLARRVRDAIRREADPALVERLHLEFGYGLFPEEAQTPNALQERARAVRIRSL